MHILFSVLLVFIIYSNSWAEQNDPGKSPGSSSSGTSSADSSPSGGSDDSTQSVTFKSLTQMNELIALGVPALALSLLQEEQDKRQPFTADWYAFEYKRIILMSALEQWSQILERTQWLLETAIVDKQITHRIRLWFETQQVMAKLQLKQGEQALSQLQGLLWDANPDQRDPSLPAIWRRLVIRSYLQLQRDDDARKALVKYDLDYNTDASDIDWIMLQAQVLLRTNRPQQAIELLQPLSTDDAKALTLIARLQSEPGSAKAINQQMRELLDGTVLSRSARWAYTYVAYLASKILADNAAQTANLEAMLSLGIESPVFDEDYQVTADDLWELYNRQGLIIANENALLVGNDEQWQKLSDKLLKSNPEKALALNAALVLNTENFVTKQQQHKTIVEIIEQRKNGLELINQLYLHSKKVVDVNVLPDEVRYRLVDYALSEGDHNEAATLMASLQEPPEGKTVFDWRMRKARVLILQGKYQQSEDLIRKTFAEKPSITRAELDRYIQVVFDFQTVQQHQQAIDLFDLISFDGLDEKIKREIYFWKAESFFSMGNYDRAALNYLESARALSGEENDLWAQSARFKAGNALVLAGIYDDAEKVYSELLLITDSDSRKALINQNLQKIHLLKSTMNKDKSKK
jgi:tetratricopeptide (TPR) repeat protein